MSNVIEYPKLVTGCFKYKIVEAILTLLRLAIYTLFPIPLGQYLCIGTAAFLYILAART